MRQSSIEAGLNFSRTGNKELHYSIIISTLSKLNKAICKDISDNCELTYHQVQRRMKELENKGKVSVVGRDVNTKCRPLIWGLT